MANRLPSAHPQCTRCTSMPVHGAALPLRRREWCKLDAASPRGGGGGGGGAPNNGGDEDTDDDNDGVIDLDDMFPMNPDAANDLDAAGVGDN